MEQNESKLNQTQSTRFPVDLQAVLFDFDGTLVETRIDFTAMKNGVLELASLYGIKDPRLAERDILGIIETAAKRLNEIEAETFELEAEAFLTEIELRACKRAKMIPHALELLERLQTAKIKIGIVTRNCRASTEEVLGHYPIPHDLLLTRNDVIHTKPNPEHLLQALDTFGVEPSKALMVGDHRMDVEGGKRAGMWTVGILAPERPDNFYHDLEPDKVVRSILEIIEWIFLSV